MDAATAALNTTVDSLMTEHELKGDLFRNLIVNAKDPAATAVELGRANVKFDDTSGGDGDDSDTGMGDVIARFRKTTGLDESAK